MRIPEGFTREELLACLDRELRYRQHVFPRRVSRSEMTDIEAIREIAMVRVLREMVEQIPPLQSNLPFPRVAGGR